MIDNAIMKLYNILQIIKIKYMKFQSPGHKTTIK